MTLDFTGIRSVESVETESVKLTDSIPQITLITCGVLLEVAWTLAFVVVSGASVRGSDPSGYSTFIEMIID